MSELVFNALKASIAQAPQQRFTFADYMDWVLYHPQHGYYSSGQVNIGIRGDFVTAIALGEDFGEILAEQFVEMWQRLGKPQLFDVLELGAGTGAFAQSVLQYTQQFYPHFFKALRYTIVEHSQFLRQRQQHLLQEMYSEKCQWRQWPDIRPEAFQGCCFSNEFFDALPVHRVGLRQGQLQEQFVTIDDQGLALTWDSLSTPALKNYFMDFGLQISIPPYEEGYETEVNLNAQSILAKVASALKRGWVLTIDYGHPAGKYYHPQRSSGTLQCYFQQRHHNNPLVNLGEQDITAHVNFTALEFWGEVQGLKSLGFTQQAPFLMSLGIGDRLVALSNGQYELNEIFRHRTTLHQLIDPNGLGKFGVLLQGKNLTTQQQTPLRGFATPDKKPSFPLAHPAAG